MVQVETKWRYLQAPEMIESLQKDLDILVVATAVVDETNSIRVVFADWFSGDFSLQELPAKDVYDLSSLEMLSPYLLRLSFQNREGYLEIPSDYIRATLDPKQRLKEETFEQENLEYLGTYIRSLRKKRKLSQVALSHRAGIGRTTLARLESACGQSPKFETLQRIAGALRVGVVDLLDNSKALQPEPES